MLQKHLFETFHMWLEDITTWTVVWLALNLPLSVSDCFQNPCCYGKQQQQQQQQPHSWQPARWCMLKMLSYRYKLAAFLLLGFGHFNASPWTNLPPKKVPPRHYFARAPSQPKTTVIQRHTNKSECDFLYCTTIINNDVASASSPSIQSQTPHDVTMTQIHQNSFQSVISWWHNTTKVGDDEQEHKHLHVLMYLD